ncbi:hypothetical protein ACWEN6_29945 [Sphaerisporangium sp. NPDC004334]
MNEHVRALIAEVLDEGLDDWVTLGHVMYRATIVSSAGPDESRKMALSALEVLLKNALAVAGNIGDSGFEAWGLSPRQAFERILSEGENRNWVFGLTDVWLANTEKGDNLARLMLVEGQEVLDRFVEAGP